MRFTDRTIAALPSPSADSGSMLTTPSPASGSGEELTFPAS